MDIETAVAESPEPVASEPSLADHEAQFSKSARQSEDSLGPDVPPASEGEPSQAGERDAQGRFRHRAQSQQATPDDAARIADLTKRLRAAEAEATSDLTQEPGESKRVFELRKRAHIAESFATSRKTPAPVAAPRPSQPASNGATSAQPVELPADFPKKPTQDQFTDWEDFVDARSDWNARKALTLDRLERARDEAATSFATGVNQRYTSASSRYPDFKAVVLDAPTSPIPRGTLLEQWTLEDDAGPDIVYHLFRHPEEVAGILSQPHLQQVKTLTLLGQRLTQPSRMPDASTRSSAAPVVAPVVKPPNLVRTGAMRAADEPPSDDSPLSEHERVYYKKRR